MNWDPDPLEGDTDATLRRLFATKSEDLTWLMDGLLEEDEATFTPHEYNRVMLLSRLQTLAVSRGWIPARLIHHFSFADLVHCVEAGRRPWHIRVLDRISDASGMVLGDKDINDVKVILHLTGMPVDDLLWP